MKSLLNIFTKLSVITGVSLFLNGCLVDNMEKITEETKDEVHATNVAIREQEELVKVGSMHTKMIDSSLSKSVRVNAAVAVLAKYPEAQLASDLGFPIPSFHIGAFKTKIGDAEVELLNVPYVGDKLSQVLGIAAINPDLLEIVAFAGVKLTKLLEAKSKASGISAEEMAEYRTITTRLAVILPALMGALALEPLENSVKALLGSLAKGEIESLAFTEGLQAHTRGAKRVIPSPTTAAALNALNQLVVNVSLDEAAIAEMRALISLRLGIN